MAVAPWRRVAVSAAGPLSEAVREDRLVWVGRQEDMVKAATFLPTEISEAAPDSRSEQQTE
jgi:hypothetical protein